MARLSGGVASARGASDVARVSSGVASTRGASGGANRGRLLELLLGGRCPLEYRGRIPGRCRTCGPRRAELCGGRSLQLRCSQATQPPKIAQATTAAAATNAAATKR